MEGGTVRRMAKSSTSNGGSGRGLLDDEGGSRRSLARFDLFPKQLGEVETHSQSGGVVTLVCIVIVTVLVISELGGFFSYDFSDRIEVDTLLHERMRINFKLTFHALGCKQVEFVAMDDFGEHQLNHDTTVKKMQIKHGGKTSSKCLSCYGAGEDGRCCNLCVDVLEAYLEQGWDIEAALTSADQCADYRGKPAKQVIKETSHEKVQHGCILEGSVLVNKVHGNFHVALGHSVTMNGKLIHQFAPEQVAYYNTSHTVHYLWIGDARLPGSHESPLDGKVQIVDAHVAQTAQYNYYLEVVPTSYRNRRYYLFTNHERVTLIGHGDQDPDKDQPTRLSELPGTFFAYRISPFAVHRTDRSTSFFDFLTHLFAIIGGTFALSRFVHSVLFSAICSVDRRSRS